MPFDEDDDISQPKINAGLKNIGNKPMTDQKANKPSQSEFEDRVKKATEKSNSYKERAAELAGEFKKMVQDKTLDQNKNLFAKEIEREVLSKMIHLAVDINNDPNEQEGMGSLTWITLLLTACLAQRDRINKLEYSISQLEKKIDSERLDKTKVSE